MSNEERPFPTVAGAACAFAASLVLNYFAGRYASLHGRDQPSLTADLLLNLLPHRDVQFLFVWGFGAFVVVAIVGCVVFERQRAAYFLWMYALLISLRSLFIILTPMGAPPGAASPGGVVFDTFGRWLTFGNDLFFSSHTAMPFLGFLIYQRPATRIIMLAFSIVLASCTLVGRFHYTIDVAAAYFITYALVVGEKRCAKLRYPRKIPLPD